MPTHSSARRHHACRLALARTGLALAVVIALVGPTHAEEFIPVDEYVGEDGLSGDAIYRRVLDNRFDAFEQVLALRSSAPGGRFSLVELRVRHKSFRGDGGRILSKTIAKYFQPSDARHLGYLVINKEDGPDDQFVYRPSARKVRRVNVRGEAIAGTDFSFEDIVPPEFEDATHHRMPDDAIADLPVFVVTVVPLPDTESEYAKLRVYVDKERYVPLRTLYWDNRRVLVKQLDVAPDSIEQRSARYEGRTKEIYVALRSRMTHLKLDSFTELEITSLEADPKLKNRHFSERELTASH